LAASFICAAWAITAEEIEKPSMLLMGRASAAARGALSGGARPSTDVQPRASATTSAAQPHDSVSPAPPWP
jgi:hypothetical protein